MVNNFPLSVLFFKLSFSLSADDLVFVRRSVWQVMRASREIHFFDRDVNYRRGLEWYRRRMPFSFDDQITVEKSPSYLVTQTVPARVSSLRGRAQEGSEAVQAAW